MSRFKSCVAAFVIALTATLVIAPNAVADTITGQGTKTGNAYRGGVAGAGGVNYAVGVQVYRNSAGAITQVRGAARISKISKVSRVQVNSVTLGTATAAITRNTTPVNSGTATTAIGYTKWVPVKAGTCTSYRTRGDYSIRWSDGVLSVLSVLSPLTKVCGPAPADKDCPDFATQAQAQAFFNTYYPNYGDFADLDADNDLRACETLP